MKLCKALLSILFISYACNAWGSQFAILKYEIGDGLSNNTVRCVVQDRSGLMWFGTADGLNRFDGKQYRIFRNNGDTPNSLGNSSICSLYADPSGDLWVGTERGVYIYSQQKDCFSRLDVRTVNHVMISCGVNSIVAHGGGRIWFGTQGQGIFIYDTKANSLRQTSRHASIVKVIKQGPNGNMYAGSEVGTISEYSPSGEYIRTLFSNSSADTQRNMEITALCVQKDTLWFSMGVRGLNAMVVGRDNVELNIIKNRPQLLNVSKIFAYSKQELFLGTDNGLYIYNINRNQTQKVADADNLFGTYHQSINDIYRDGEGGVWIGTQYGGVHYIPRPLKIFRQQLSLNNPGSLEAMAVNCFVEDKHNNIWVGTRNGGLLHLNTKTGENITQKFNVSNISNIQTLMLDNHTLWIGTYAQGVFVLNLKSGKVSNYTHRRGVANTISDNCVNKIFKSASGTIYVGTTWGLNTYNSDKDDFQTESRADNQPNISDIIQDDKGNIWFASNNIGLFRLDPVQDKWQYYSHNPKDSTSLIDNNVITLLKDRRGRIWVGTKTGLCHFDYSNGAFIRLNPQNGKFSGEVFSLEQDRAGHLWVCGGVGLFCLDIEQNRIINQFLKIDGLQCSPFNYRASLKGSDGRVYFGGVNGFNSFDPGQLHNNTYLPKVLITNMYINNKEIEPTHSPRKSSSPADSLSLFGIVKLHSTENSIAFDFASTSYESPSKNLYSYKLDGWDSHWSVQSNISHASYSNLPCGRYTMMVRGSNNDGLWSEDRAQLYIIIMPPLYRTNVAYIVYLIVLLVGLRLLVRAIRKRQQRRLREFATEQQKKSYRAKIDFFTNIAHEIRTPLTLIKIPLQSIIDSGDGGIKTRNYLDIMNNNAGNLLNLINQLLDFRRSEEVNYELTFTAHNIGDLIRETCVRFNAVAQINNIELKIQTPPQAVVYNVDSEAMTKIVTNLVSNAIKYAKSSVIVTLRDRGDSFVLSVQDDGQGVEATQQKKIFEAFYQISGSKAGSGIGLPLAKSLTQKHNGTIGIESQVGEGSLFSVTIPKLLVSNLCQSEEFIIGDSQMYWGTRDSTQNEPPLRGELFATTVLVVEDNSDLRGIIADIISKRHSVLIAENGKAALEVLEREDVDIIVTDLMMPQMDGYQLCEFIKSDIRYSHIPVIQLTAKKSLEDRIKGLEYGSDAYIEKPFVPEHLISQIANLLENRRSLQQKYSSSIFNKPQTPHTGLHNREEEFIRRLNQEIEENIQKEEFYIDTLAESLCMSRSNFYRKIKGLFGISPNDYLRRFRLQKAAVMLQQGKYRASDVYEIVGFNSLSYFSTCFKSQFGVSPTKYVEQQKEGIAEG